MTWIREAFKVTTTLQEKHQFPRIEINIRVMHVSKKKCHNFSFRTSYIAHISTLYDKFVRKISNSQSRKYSISAVHSEDTTLSNKASIRREGENDQELYIFHLMQL